MILFRCEQKDDVDVEQEKYLFLLPTENFQEMVNESPPHTQVSRAKFTSFFDQKFLIV